MLFVIDPHSGVPVFRQLIEQVKFHIASGLLRPGDELPSIRTLSVPLGINPMTISKAYNILVREEVLESRPGRPLVVRAVATEQMEVRKMDQLRESLKPTITMISQLAIGRDEALRVFREMLEQVDRPDAPRSDGPRPEDAPR